MRRSSYQPSKQHHVAILNQSCACRNIDQACFPLCCRVTFAPKVAGTYELSILLDGQAIGAPAGRNVSVQHGPLFPAATVLTSETFPAVAGQQYEMAFSVFDSFGNAYAAEDTIFGLRAAGVGGLQASVTGALSSTCQSGLSEVRRPQMGMQVGYVADAGSVVGGAAAGSYAGTMTATAAGDYKMSVNLIPGSGRQAIAVLSYNVTITAAAADPMASQIRGGGLTSAVVGQQATFVVNPSSAL